MSERECGSCYSCCVWLGIKELNKRAMAACKHLTGTNGPAHRCSIYESRPLACSEYSCGWLAGLFDDDMRPDQCGLLVTIYAAPDSPIGANGLPAHMWVTINIVDAEKAGTMENGPLAHMLRYLLSNEEQVISQLTVVDHRKRTVLEFTGGEVYAGTMFATKNVEELVFKRDKKLGHYLSASSVDAIPAHLRKRGMILH